MSVSNEGFSPELFSALASAEANNFWFKSRNQLIINMLGRHAPNMGEFLEVGCGTGFVISGVSKVFPDCKFTGSELFEEGLVYARKRLPDAEFRQLDARNLPFSQSYDVIGSFDVLEHIEQDEEVLAEFHKALKKDGIIILTVPQHRWLWSVADEHAKHVRRYTKNELENKVEAAGFEILRSSSFVSLLLPVMLISRLLSSKTKEYDPMAEFRIPRWLNHLFYISRVLENKAIEAGLNIPFGGSRMLVAVKK